MLNEPGGAHGRRQNERPVTMPGHEPGAVVGPVKAVFGFVHAICGDLRTMPGLSSHPAAESIDIDENGDVVGLS